MLVRSGHSKPRKPILEIELLFATVGDRGNERSHLICRQIMLMSYWDSPREQFFTRPITCELLDATIKDIQGHTQQQAALSCTT